MGTASLGTFEKPEEVRATLHELLLEMNEAWPAPATQKTRLHLTAGETCARRYLGARQHRSHPTIMKAVSKTYFTLISPPSMHRGGVTQV